MSARTVLSLLLITMTLPTACQAVPVSPAEGSLRPYQVPQVDLALDVPTGWALMPGPQEIHMRRTSLVTLNNLGRGNLWITEQPVGPSGSEYGPDAVLATLPPGGVYVELANIGGPAVSLIGPEIEPGDLAALNAEATWATGEDDRVLRRELLFARWGQCYALTAYAVEPINPADRAIVEHIFDSLRLTTQPASAARASIALARAHLPPETRPGLFPLRAGQTEAGASGGGPGRSATGRMWSSPSPLAEESLEAMLDNVERGSFRPYMISAEPVQLGGLEALKVTLRQAPEGLSQLWLVIIPQSQQQGQGLTIAAYGDPALAEAIVATWRPVSPSVRHGQPTSPAWIYRLGNEVYRADAVGEHSQHVLDLPENADHPCLSDSFLTYTD